MEVLKNHHSNLDDYIHHNAQKVVAMILYLIMPTRVHSKEVKDSLSSCL